MTGNGIPRFPRVYPGFLALYLCCSAVHAAGVVQFADRAVSATEGEDLDITLIRSADDAGAVSAVINIGISSSASLNIDYSVDLPGGVVNFQDGQLSTSFRVTLEQDDDVEGTEFALISLGSPGGGGQIGSRDTIRMEILDDDVAAVTLDLQTLAVERVDEGQSLDIAVARSGSASSAQSVELASRGLTAVDGTDFTGISSQLEFTLGGADLQTVTLFTSSNNLADGNRLLEVQLSDPQPAGTAVIGFLNTLLVIVDDEPDAPGEFSLEAPQGNRISEAGGSIQLDVVRSGGARGAATVSFVTAAGTGQSGAVPGEDYVAETRELAFADGETRQSFQVQMVDDQQERAASRDFRVILAQASAPATINPEAYDQVITVLEDDAVAGDGCRGLCDCFVATAAYGSYLAPQVASLRQFRDQVLMKYRLGRRFVAWYYRVSPKLAATISGSTTLRWATRLALTPLVYSINYPLMSLGFLGFVCVAGLAWGMRRRALHSSPGLV